MIAIYRPGKSAYQLAVEGGFEGTVEEWLAALAVGGTLPAGLCKVSLNDATGTHLVFKNLSDETIGHAINSEPEE